MKIKRAFILLSLVFCCSCININNSSSNQKITSSSKNISTKKDSILNNILTADVNDDDINVVICAGQSNMEGNTFLENLYQNCSPEYVELYKEGFENTQICYANCQITYKNFTDVKAGQGQTSLKFGPELGFAQYLDENCFGKKTYIIKYALPATSLYEHWVSPTSVEEGLRPSVGVFYKGLVDYANSILNKMVDNGMNPIVRAICWMQGENDSVGSQYLSYENLENNLINDLQNEFDNYSSDFGIRFIDAGISDSSCWTFYREINKAKKNNQAKDKDLRFYIDTISEKLDYSNEPSLSNVDFYHYDSLSMIKLGQLFAKQYSLIMGY